MKYKVGDTVYVKSLEWYNTNKDKYGNITFDEFECFFISEMQQYCNKKLTIKDVNSNGYHMIEVPDFIWVDEMLDIRRIRKKKIKKIKKSLH